MATDFLAAEGVLTDACQLALLFRCPKRFSIRESKACSGAGHRSSGSRVVQKRTKDIQSWNVIKKGQPEVVVLPVSCIVSLGHQSDSLELSRSIALPAE